MHRLYVIALSTLLFFGVLSAQTKETCLACHSDKTLTMEKNGKTVSLFAKEEALKKSPHAKMDCVTCHAGFDPGNIPHKEKIRPVQCQSCHKDAPAKHAFHKTVISDGKDAAEMCKECHGTHDVVVAEGPGLEIQPGERC